MTSITVRALRDKQRPAVIDLMRAQQGRHYRLDHGLPGVYSRGQVEARLSTLVAQGEVPLVALDTEAHVRGSACPGVWELPEQSSLYAFLSPKNGVARLLALPDPIERDALAVASALLTALSDAWRRKELRLFPRIVAPVVSTLMLLVPLASYVLPPLPLIGPVVTQLGFAPTPFPANILPLFVLAWALVGQLYAAVLARRSPERDAQLGLIPGDGQSATHVASLFETSQEE